MVPSSALYAFSLPLILTIYFSLLGLAFATSFLAFSVLAFRVVIVYFQLLTAILPYYLLPRVSKICKFLLGDHEKISGEEEEATIQVAERGSMTSGGLVIGEGGPSLKRRRRRSSSNSISSNVVTSGSITPTLFTSTLQQRALNSDTVTTEIAPAVVGSGNLSFTKSPPQRTLPLRSSYSLTSLQSSTIQRGGNAIISPAISTLPKQQPFSPLPMTKASTQFRDYEGIGGWRLTSPYGSPDSEDSWLHINDRLVLPGVAGTVRGTDSGRRHRRRSTASFSGTVALQREKKVAMATNELETAERRDVDEDDRVQRAQTGRASTWRGSGIWEGESSRSRSPEKERKAVLGGMTSNIGRVRSKVA